MTIYYTKIAAFVDVLPRLIDYDRDTGVLTWKQREREFFKSDRDCAAWNTSFAGRTSGRMRRGYVVVRVLGVDLMAHRIAWVIHYGKWPDNCVDHRDGNRSNNAISNLRDVTVDVNNQNITKKRVCQSSLPIGVFLEPKSKRSPYVSRMKLDKKTIYLGCFSTPELAHAAYLAAKRQLHPGCTL